MQWRRHASSSVSGDRDRFDPVAGDREGFDSEAGDRDRFDPEAGDAELLLRADMASGPFEITKTIFPKRKGMLKRVDNC